MPVPAPADAVVLHTVSRHAPRRQEDSLRTAFIQCCSECRGMMGPEAADAVVLHCHKTQPLKTAPRTASRQRCDGVLDSASAGAVVLHAVSRQHLQTAHSHLEDSSAIDVRFSTCWRSSSPLYETALQHSKQEQAPARRRPPGMAADVLSPPTPVCQPHGLNTP
jgi:hypothetical protein